MLKIQHKNFNKDCF